MKQLKVGMPLIVCVSVLVTDWTGTGGLPHIAAQTSRNDIIRNRRGILPGVESTRIPLQHVPPDLMAWWLDDWQYPRMSLYKWQAKAGETAKRFSMDEATLSKGEYADDGLMPRRPPLI